MTVQTTTAISKWFNRTLQSAIPSKVFYTSLYSGLQSTKISRDGLRLWSRDTFSFRDELRLWSRDTLFWDELKLGSRVTLSLNLTVYPKILHNTDLSLCEMADQHVDIFYGREPTPARGYDTYWPVYPALWTDLLQMPAGRDFVYSVNIFIDRFMRLFLINSYVFMK